MPEHYYENKTNINASTKICWPLSALAMCSAVLSLCMLVACTTQRENLSSRPAKTDDQPNDPSLLSLDRIFTRNDFKTQEWGPARWLSDNSGYTTLEKPATFSISTSLGDTNNVKDIVRYDAKSGRREVIVMAEHLVAAGKTQPLKIKDYTWSDDGQTLLIFTNTKRVWRHETRGDYWVLDLKSKSLKQLGGDTAPSTMMFATFSPNGRQVAYVSCNNLYVQSIDDLKITQLTKDGSTTIINGTSDWVYEEEFDLRNGFRWSPDGAYIAYWQFDSSEVREFKLINYTDSLYPTITSYGYPKVGETNSACHVGVVKASGGQTRWFSPNADARNHYIPHMEWTKDSRHVVFQQLNRLQNTNKLIRGNIANGDIEVLHADVDTAWVEVITDWHWLENGKRFLWTSEREGWQRIYAITCADQQSTPLTPNNYDAISIAGVDEKQGYVYFIASPDNPTQRYLYRAPLNGSGSAERVSPKNQTGTHAYTMSTDCRWAFHTYSRFDQPPIIELISLPEHKVIRVLVDNVKLRTNLAALKACTSEFLRVDIGGGIQCDAWRLKSPNLNTAKQHPLLIYVYGEPANATVKDAWGGNYLWHRLLVQQGYVVMSIDNRGTPAPRGRAWRKGVYRQIGIQASADQAAALRQILKDSPYIDPTRVGIWGWSGGGSMSLNAIFRYPELYRTAMAIAFVSNQKFYDTIYQERYMGLPNDNVDGFINGSPITFAHQLKGNLLLVYGTGDDNCHYQNCELLINELIKNNKMFSVMPYPNRTHAIKEGDNTTLHLFETLTRYLKENLPQR